MSTDATPPQPPARRGFWIGCGTVVLLLLLCGGVIAFAVWRGVDFFQAEVAKSAEDEAFAQAWTPPVTDAPDAAFAPPAVAGYALKSSDEQAAFPALGIESDGHHAIYEAAGKTIEVSVYDADESQADATFDEIGRRINSGERFRSRSTVRTTRRLNFDIAPPELHGVLWSAKGRLIFVRSATAADLGPFLTAYLTAIGRRADAKRASERADAEPAGEVAPASDPVSPP